MFTWKWLICKQLLTSEALSSQPPTHITVQTAHLPDPLSTRFPSTPPKSLYLTNFLPNWPCFSSCSHPTALCEYNNIMSSPTNSPPPTPAGGVTTAYEQTRKAIDAMQNKAPVSAVDFTIHLMEDGTEVSTQERVCKGIADVFSRFC